ADLGIVQDAGARRRFLILVTVADEHSFQGIGALPVGFVENRTDARFVPSPIPHSYIEVGLERVRVDPAFEYVADGTIDGGRRSHRAFDDRPGVLAKPILQKLVLKVVNAL